MRHLGVVTNLDQSYRLPVDKFLEQESIHFLGVLRRLLCLLATAELWIPSLKSRAELVIEDVHPHLQ